MINDDILLNKVKFLKYPKTPGTPTAMKIQWDSLHIWYCNIIYCLSLHLLPIYALFTTVSRHASITLLSTKEYRQSFALYLHWFWLIRRTHNSRDKLKEICYTFPLPVPLHSATLLSNPSIHNNPLLIHRNYEGKGWQMTCRCFYPSFVVVNLITIVVSNDDKQPTQRECSSSDRYISITNSMLQVEHVVFIFDFSSQSFARSLSVTRLSIAP